MMINDYPIYVFTPEFALHRILGDDAELGNAEGDLTYLCTQVASLSNTYREFTEGDALICRERDYHKYPNRIAVIYEVEGTFKMQVFQNNTVGKRYDDILTQQEDIRPFFDCAASDIIVLENHFARELPRDLDQIIAYIEKIQTARQEYEKHKQTIEDCIARHHRLMEEGRRFIGKALPDTLHRAEVTTVLFIDQLFTLIDEVNQKSCLDIDKCYLPISEQEKQILTFGLYYCCLKQGLKGHLTLRRAQAYSNLLREMHGFLKSHPLIVEEYCEYMDFSPFDRRTIEALLQNEGLLRERWISAADDLL